MPFGIIEKGMPKEKRLRNKFGFMFLFGVIFTILMITQGLLIDKLLFYTLEIFELGIVYLLIKKFTKKEMEEENE